MRTSRLALWASVSALTLSASALADTVTLNPVKDNTLYENVGGLLSNGAGQQMFAGQAGNGVIQRGVMDFDIAGAIPAGSTINSVTMTLFMSRTNNTNVENVSLHRLAQDWGEGTSAASSGEGGGAASTPGDATWIHTFFPGSFWTNPGGDFSVTASATTGVGFIADYNWASALLTADVQDMLDNPGGDHGWALIGNEFQDSKRFSSRQNVTISQRPRLLIDFTPPAAAVPSLNGIGIAMLGLLLAGAGYWQLRR